MSTIDQQFVEYISKTLVNNPDKVNVERSVDERGVLLSLTVDASDIGRIIGKNGTTAQSIRSLLRALGTKNQARYNLKVIDNSASKSQSTSSSEIIDSSISGGEDNLDDFSSKTRAEIAELDDIEI